MIDEFMKRFQKTDPKIRYSDDDLDDLERTIKRFRNSLIIGATFGAIRDSLTILLEDQKPFFTPSTIALDSLNTALELSTFNLLDEVIRIKNNRCENSFKYWIKNIMLASAGSTCINQLVMMPLSKYYFWDKYSKSDMNNLIEKFFYDAGFNTCSRIANRYLPKPDKIGGEFARSSAVIGIGSLGATIASAPYATRNSAVTYSRIFRDFAHSIPLIVIDNCLYSMVQKTLTPYLK